MKFLKKLKLTFQQILDGTFQKVGLNLSTSSKSIQIPDKLVSFYYCALLPA